MFLNQLGPLLWPEKRKEVRGEQKEQVLEQLVERLGVMVRVAEMEGESHRTFPETKRKRDERETKRVELELTFPLSFLPSSLAPSLTAAKIYTSELQPILSIPATSSSPTPIELLEKEMEQVLIDARIRSHPAVAPVWAKAVAYGREKDAAAATEGEMIGGGK